MISQQLVEAFIEDTKSLAKTFTTYSNRWTPLDDLLSLQVSQAQRVRNITKHLERNDSDDFISLRHI